MGVVDDDGVGIGNVQSRFDNGGGYEYVVGAINKIEHDFLERGAVHLSVCHYGLDVGKYSLNQVLNFLNVLNAVVDKEHLTVALHFVKEDRKSTRLNSSHVRISYAVF